MPRRRFISIFSFNLSPTPSRPLGLLTPSSPILVPDEGGDRLSFSGINSGGGDLLKFLHFIYNSVFFIIFRNREVIFFSYTWQLNVLGMQTNLWPKELLKLWRASFGAQFQYETYIHTYIRAYIYRISHL